MSQNFFNNNSQSRLDFLEQQAIANPFFQKSYPNMIGNPSNQQNQNNVIYSLVSGGLEAVKAFPLRPGIVGLLFDDRENVFFIKTVDAMGIQSIKKHTYQQVALPEETVAGIANGNNAPNSEISELKKQLGELQMLMANFMQSKDAEKSEKSEAKK